MGDTLLLQGTWGALEDHLDDPDVLVVDPPALVRRQAVPLGPGAKQALVVLAGMVILLVTGLVPPAVAGLLAAGAIILSGVLTVEQAYRGIAWTTVILVGGMIPLSTAMVETGAAETARRAPRRRRRRRRAARAPPRARRPHARPRPADQQHGDRADRDPDRRLGRGGARRLREAGADGRLRRGGGVVPDAGRDAREPDGDGPRRLPVRATTGSSGCPCWSCSVWSRCSSSPCSGRSEGCAWTGARPRRERAGCGARARPQDLRGARRPARSRRGTDVVLLVPALLGVPARHRRLPTLCVRAAHWRGSSPASRPGSIPSVGFCSDLLWLFALALLAAALVRRRFGAFGQALAAIGCAALLVTVRGAARARLVARGLDGALRGTSEAPPFPTPGRGGHGRDRLALAAPRPAVAPARSLDHRSSAFSVLRSWGSARRPDDRRSADRHRRRRRGPARVRHVGGPAEPRGRRGRRWPSSAFAPERSRWTSARSAASSTSAAWTTTGDRCW